LTLGQPQHGGVVTRANEQARVRRQSAAQPFDEFQFHGWAFPTANSYATGARCYGAKQSIVTDVAGSVARRAEAKRRRISRLIDRLVIQR
jgi:hypothetical protein